MPTVPLLIAFLLLTPSLRLAVRALPRRAHGPLRQWRRRFAKSPAASPPSGEKSVEPFTPLSPYDCIQQVSEGEKSLLAGAREGDRDAFDALVGPHIDGAFGLAFGLLHDREAAEDAVQEAAVKAWRKIGNVRTGAPVRPWFFGIVANQCREQRRARWCPW